MSGQLLSPTDIDNEVGLADWLEATMLLEAKEYVPRAKIRKYLRSLFSEDQPDVAVDVLLQEIARRQRNCQSAYPFMDDGSGVRLKKTATAIPYLFMLCISTSKPYRDEHRYSDTDELFDSLVLQALTNYIGKGGKGVRFGAPASGKRPKNFQEGIEWLARQLNLPQGRGKPRRTGGDGGLDVIVWRPFRDRKGGFLILMAQCTVQLEWISKAKDLHEDIWRGWIDLGKDPHLVLAIPHVIPANYDKWDDLRRLVHTAVDRLRLAELMNGAPLTGGDEMKKWIASEVVRMGGAA